MLYVCVCCVLSRIENWVLKVEDRELCIKDQESGILILENQGSGFDTEFCPLLGHPCTLRSMSSRVEYG